jgi:exopolysaccharide biosynthesis protein
MRQTAIFAAGHFPRALAVAGGVFALVSVASADDTKSPSPSDQATVTDDQGYQIIMSQELQGPSLTYQKLVIPAKPSGTLSVAHVVQFQLDSQSAELILSEQSQRGQRPSEFAQIVSSLVTINGSFFDINYKALGLSVAGGQRYSGTAESEDFQVFGCARDLNCYAETTIGKVQEGVGLPKLYTAVSGKPTLVNQGWPRSPSQDSKCPDFCQKRHPRSAIGMDSARRVLILALIEGRQPGARGASLAELARFMRNRGAYSAINLDGGGSSSLVIQGSVVNGRPDNEPDERPVSNALSIIAIQD